MPEGVTRLERLPIAEMPGGFRLAADVYYREKCPAKARPALIFMHDWASGIQPVLAGYDKFSSEVNLAIINAGMCDVVRDFGRHANEIAIMGGSVDDMPARYREASPLHRFRAGMPPVIMIHGELDQSCPLASAQAACERLRQLGVTVELVVRPKCGHGLDGFGLNLSSHLDTALQFIRKQWPGI